MALPAVDGQRIDAADINAKVNISDAAPLTNTPPQPFGPTRLAGTSVEAMRADAVFALPAGVSASAGNAAFGTGQQGAVVFDGAAAASGAWDKVGSTYKLKVDLNATDVTVSSGVTLDTGMFVLSCSGTLTNNGTITATFLPATGATAGGIPQPASASGGQTLGSGRAGASGTTGVGAAANAGGSAQSFAGNAGGFGGAGTAGAGGAGAAVGTHTSINQNSLRRAPGCYTAIISVYNNNNSVFYFGPAQGGGGGGSGAGDGSNAGGGGGSGGSIAIVNARTFVNNGLVTAPGGAGGTPIGGNCGGGGGGGGGVVVVNAVVASGSGTITAPGGAGGAKTGTGVAGSAGTAGLAALNVWA